MGQTILLAYNGTDNSHYRALAVAGSPAWWSFLAIQPTTKKLGISVGTTFYASNTVIEDSTWYRLACTLDGTSVGLFVNGGRVMTFTALPDISAYPVDRIGNADTHFILTAGGAPSMSLAPSTMLAPSVSTTFDTQSNANGIIDEVQRYSVVLTDPEIYAYSQAGTLYQALPTYSLQEGFKEALVSGTLVTSIDGYKHYRTRWTGTPTNVTVSMKLTFEQVQVLDYFYETTTQGGLIPFNFVDPATDTTIEAIMATRPSYTRDGIYYLASINLEVQP